jgi:tRNA-uridine 2-sulfurtransferase
VSGTVIVGPREALDVQEIDATAPVWSGCPPPSSPLPCLVQLRAHGEVYPAVCAPSGDRITISLHEPARGVAPGQAAVFYDGDAVLGSATISSTRPAA